MTLLPALIGLLAVLANPEPAPESAPEPGPEPDPEAQILSSLQAMESAWRRVDLDQAAIEAESALRLIEASRCPERPDAVLAATIAALAGPLAEIETPSGYLYWVAAQLDLDMQVLPAELGEAVEFLSSEPGEFVDEDLYFMGSAYRQADRSNAQCPAPLLDVSMLTDQSDGEFNQAILVQRYPRGAYRSNVLWERGASAFGYPARIAEPLHEAIAAQPGRAPNLGQFVVRRFDPCARLSQRDLSFRNLCIEDIAP